MLLAFRIAPLGPDHERAGFACGTEPLDRYLKTQATQDMRRRVANCFVAVPEGGTTIAGFYTLSAAAIPLSDLPAEQTRRLPRYPVLPAALIGRLAVDRQFQGQKLGAVLLLDAILRALRADPAVLTLIVQAKDDAAAAFYGHHGFRAFASSPSHLFLPAGTAEGLLREER